DVIGVAGADAGVFYVDAVAFVGFDDVARVDVGVCGRAYGLEVCAARQDAPGQLAVRLPAQDGDDAPAPLGRVADFLRRADLYVQRCNVLELGRGGMRDLGHGWTPVGRRSAAGSNPASCL